MAMNEFITVQQVTETRSSTGAVSESWATHVQSWADIQQLSGTEQFSSDMTVYTDTKKFILNYQEAKDITSKMRISYNSAYYNITSVNHEPGRVRTTLIAYRNDDE